MHPVPEEGVGQCDHYRRRCAINAETSLSSASWLRLASSPAMVSAPEIFSILPDVLAFALPGCTVCSYRLLNMTHTAGAR